ncbi:MAG: folylpolyglutamate synthase/dihydrofolate synthase family protein [Bacillota bacterium]|nr:folylpolyglutamate synthase/dihydrofolate synthase family protein [Bacillota bacterium]
MFTTYQAALDWIHARLRLGIKPGLKRMEWMMERLGNPEKSSKAVHIGGTNGKGSTVTFLRSILQSNGYTVGTFTSPYIEEFNERISVNGAPIRDDELVQLTNIIRPLADELEETALGGPTEFEVITAMAFYYFSKMRPVDIVLYEVGLGGRFDSTNIIFPHLSIITNIGLDHTNILGDTYEKIAFEKAGIIKKNTPIFTAVKRQDALKVIEEQAVKMKAPIFRINHEFTIDSYRPLERGEKFTLKPTYFPIIEEIEIGMIGQHQTENAALAVMAANYLNECCSFVMSQEKIKEGLKQAFWPGRFEILSEKPLVIIDGAHNDEGVTALVNELSTRFGNKQISIVFAAMQDKSLHNMVAKLDQIAHHITFVSFDYPRAAEASTLYELSISQNKTLGKNWEKIILNELKVMGKDHILVVTGSLYFISRAKPFLKNTLK